MRWPLKVSALQRNSTGSSGTGFSIQEGRAVVLDPTNLKVIVARIAPAEWGGIAQMRGR